MLAPYHDFNPATDEGALAAAIKAAPHDDTPKLVMADYLDDHDHPEAAAMYRYAVHMARTDPDGDRGSFLRLRSSVTPHAAAVLSRHAALLSRVGVLKQHNDDPDTAEVTSGVHTAATAAVRLATGVVNHGVLRDAGRGRLHNRHKTTAYYHAVLADIHHPETGVVRDAISHYANRYAAAVHSHQAEHPADLLTQLRISQARNGR